MNHTSLVFEPHSIYFPFSKVVSSAAYAVGLGVPILVRRLLLRSSVFGDDTNDFKAAFYFLAGAYSAYFHPLAKCTLNFTSILP